ncbi:MAG: Peptidoglycan N-acetylglucosamine deacetylase [Ktedonobacterales bacterium]|nr:MAG: Peptidoglycan N-acetylglucosamine deacetylase [Ktedonobacterales bacterium]
MSARNAGKYGWLAVILAALIVVISACAVSPLKRGVAQPTAMPTATATSIPPTPTLIPPTPTPKPKPTVTPGSGGSTSGGSPGGVQRGGVVYQGNGSIPEIALTFDDGPWPGSTTQILNILQQNDVHATFFCIGRQVPWYPTFVQQEIANGNDVGNHTWDHPNLTKLAPSAIHTEMSRTSAALAQVTGKTPVLFRAPDGAINYSVVSQAKALGMTPIQWNVDTRDWSRPGVASVVRTALAGARNGAIILMHDGGGDRSQTVQALPQIISALRARGYRFVTITQLLKDAHMLKAMTPPASQSVTMLAPLSLGLAVADTPPRNRLPYAV